MRPFPFVARASRAVAILRQRKEVGNPGRRLALVGARRQARETGAFLQSDAPPSENGDRSRALERAPSFSEHALIDLGLFFAFAAAVVVLMLIPGPNVALIVANSIAYGPRYGLLTVAGASSAMVLQLALTALGMTELLGTLGVWFAYLRWIGVAYLLYLGVIQWRAPAADLAITRAQPKSPRALFLRALFVSLTNPKTLFFYGAFFPQFINASKPIGAQIAILSATFLALALLIDGGWALVAGRARHLLAARGRLRNRVSGGFLIGAGAALAFARNK
jgi:threonine/homoserine/homoserine lactone efflux protein